MIRRLFSLALIVGLVAVVGSLPAAPQAPVLSGSLALGVLLLGGYLAGQLAVELRLPKLSGYMIFGLVAGPELGQLLAPSMLSALRPVDGLAVALIALSAGAELRPAWLKKNLRRVLLISASLALIVTLGLTAMLILLQMIGVHLPFPSELPLGTELLLASLLAVALSSTSPLVVLAVNAETGARGPVSDALLGVSIVMDLVAVVGTAVLIAFTRGALGIGGESRLAMTLSWELLGSVGAGLILGGLLVLYVRFVGRELAVVVSVLCLLISEIGLRLHLEPLLLAMTAGLVLGAFGGDRTERVTHAMERIGLPIFALFFGLLGAGLDLTSLAGLGLLGGSLVLARGGLLYLSTNLGAKVDGAPREVQRFTFFGLISQAGVTLGIAVTLKRSFPEFGNELSALLVGIAAVNTLVGPILHRVGAGLAKELPLAPSDQKDGASPGAGLLRSKGLPIPSGEVFKQR